MVENCIILKRFEMLALLCSCCKHTAVQTVETYITHHAHTPKNLPNKFLSNKSNNQQSPTAHIFKCWRAITQQTITHNFLNCKKALSFPKYFVAMPLVVTHKDESNKRLNKGLILLSVLRFKINNLVDPDWLLKISN